MVPPFGAKKKMICIKTTYVTEIGEKELKNLMGAPEPTNTHRKCVLHRLKYDFLTGFATDCHTAGFQICFHFGSPHRLLTHSLIGFLCPTASWKATGPAHAAKVKQQNSNKGHGKAWSAEARRGVL